MAEKTAFDTFWGKFTAPGTGDVEFGGDQDRATTDY
jgi:hypothetical protein